MPSIINATTSTGLVSSADNSGSLQLATNNGTTAVTINTSQNVGIGISSPTAKLHTQIGSGVSNGIKALNGGGGGLQIYTDSNVANADVFIESPLTGVAMAFLNGGAERMRIDYSGNLLVGKTSYSSTANGFQFGPADNGANIGLLSITGNSTNAGATAIQLYSTSNSTFRFYVNYAGTIFAQSTTISGISDQRLKENITDLDAGLNAVMALKPRKFDWKEGKGKDIKGDRGFIAQEFETVFPDMIDTWKDPAPEGEEPYKSVRADLIPVLVKAIQELNAKVEAQAVRIAELEGAK